MWLAFVVAADSTARPSTVVPSGLEQSTALFSDAGNTWTTSNTFAVRWPNWTQDSKWAWSCAASILLAELTLQTSGWPANAAASGSDRVLRLPKAYTDLSW